MNRTDGLSEDDLIRAAKIMFTEFGLPKKQHQVQAQASCQTDLNNIAGR